MQVRLVGRFEPSSPDLARREGTSGLRFAWSGSTIEARFTGPSIAMRLRVAPLAPHPVQVDGKTVMLDEKTTAYSVRVDDRAPITIEVSADKERYELASGLDPATPHLIGVMREAEAFAGVDELLGLELGPGGALLPPPQARSRRIEIVGDSITCGYGVLGADAKCSFTYATERASAAYGALLARKVDADVTTVCWSGRGVARNYDGSTKGTMPELFELALPEAPQVPWAFKTPPPQLVIVALGTNDFLGDGGKPLDLGAFEYAYVQFVRRLADAYGSPWVVLTTSPMIGAESGNLGELARSRLARVVERRVREGDNRIELVTLPTAAPHWGCDGHPDTAMNARIAEVLAPVVRSRLPP